MFGIAKKLLHGSAGDLYLSNPPGDREGSKEESEYPWKVWEVGRDGPDADDVGDMGSRYNAWFPDQVPC